MTALPANRRSYFWAIVFVTSMLWLGACSEDSPVTVDDPLPVNRDLTVQMRGLLSTPTFGGRPMRVWVIDDARNVIVTQAVYNSIPMTDFDLVLPNSVAPGDRYRLDSWLDFNMNGECSAIGAFDRSWRQDLTGADPLVVTHQFTDMVTSFQPCPPLGLGEDFVLNLSGMGLNIGQMMELRLIDTDADRVVGYFRVAAIMGDAFPLRLVDMAATSTNYRVDFYADANGNSSYDPPPTDHAWRLTGRAGLGGLTINFSHNDTYTDIGF